METASFANSIAEWHDFYLLTVGAAATLLGLLFVVVSINLSLFTNPAHPQLRAEATDTFTCFLYLVLVSLIIVAPNPDPTSSGWALLIFSAVELVNTQRETGRARRLLRTGWRGYLLDLVPSVFCYVGMMVLAGAAILGHAQLVTDGWMIPLVATFLGTATGNAWDLMLRAGVVQGAARSAE